ncbi:hypothetical protein F3Y22_tig00111191pilonHSYRG00139 [Hibiscus syriacus]|uniref:Uncharacterized protein n=1 Tax=Hibiscus syriacus TaxID=106335 RepID=A0A6A2YXN7_HIBSY|nr:hypothetical protein F3Y22_tig00111191pilonHSYRG00139 [Hibiscus syriacus]
MNGNKRCTRVFGLEAGFGMSLGVFWGRLGSFLDISGPWSALVRVDAGWMILDSVSRSWFPTPFVFWQPLPLNQVFVPRFVPYLVNESFNVDDFDFPFIGGHGAYSFLDLEWSFVSSYQPFMSILIAQDVCEFGKDKVTFLEVYIPMIFVCPLLGTYNRVGCERLMSVYNLELALVGGFALLQVVGKLCHVQKLWPVALGSTYVVPKINFYESIDSFGLPVGLWVDCS